MAKTFFPVHVRGFINLLCTVPISVQFYDFLGRSFTRLFKEGTGLSPSPKITAGRIDRDDDLEMYERGGISKLNFRIGIANTVTYDIAFCWKSKSGKIIGVDEEDFDENDLECWLEGLLPETYYADLALYTNKRPPFKIKDLLFELEIRDYAYTMDVFVALKDDSVSKEVSYLLEKIIIEHNNLADPGDEKKPLQAVHNWRFSHLNDGRIKIYLDAASSDILRKMVKALAKRDDVFKVEMDLNS